MIGEIFFFRFSVKLVSEKSFNSNCSESKDLPVFNPITFPSINLIEFFGHLKQEKIKRKKFFEQKNVKLFNKN
jgi:hypothetical protein